MKKKKEKKSSWMKKEEKKSSFVTAIFTPFMSKSLQIWDHIVTLLLSKDSKNLKTLDIRLWEVGPKRLLNGVRKCERQTDKQTHKQTFQLIERIDPQGGFFENLTWQQTLWF